MRVVLLLAALLVPGLAPAADLRVEDAARLAGLDASLGRGLAQALAEGDPADIDVLLQAMRGAALPPDPAGLEGDWSCRMLKLGGNLPLVVYQPFRCRVDGSGDALVFQKTTGSQRTQGVVQEEAGRLLYLGVTHGADEVPPDYSALPPATDPTAMPQHFADVGVVEQVGPDRARILFPAPWLESDFNILLLTR